MTWMIWTAIVLGEVAAALLLLSTYGRYRWAVATQALLGRLEAALVTTVVAAARGALVDGTVVMTPWEGRMSNYQERNGIRVPLTDEAAWLSTDERKPYWRGTIVSAVYEFSL